MDREQSDYLSYLLRLWRVSGDGETHRGDEESHRGDGKSHRMEKTVWRASLENPHTGERQGFANLTDLFIFLEEETCQVARCQATPDA